MKNFGSFANLARKPIYPGKGSCLCVSPEKCTYSKYSDRVKSLIHKAKLIEQTQSKLNLYVVTLHTEYFGFVLARSDLTG